MIFRKRTNRAKEKLRSLINSEGAISDFLLDKMLNKHINLLWISNYHGSMELKKSSVSTDQPLHSKFWLTCYSIDLLLYGLSRFSVRVDFLDTKNSVDGFPAEFWVSDLDLSEIEAEHFISNSDNSWSDYSFAGIDIYDHDGAIRKQVMDLMLSSSATVKRMPLLSLKLHTDIWQPGYGYNAENLSSDTKRVGIESLRFSYSLRG